MINGVPAAAATGRVAMFSLLPLPDTDTERFPGPASPFSVKFPLPHAIFFSPPPMLSRSGSCARPQTFLLFFVIPSALNQENQSQATRCQDLGDDVAGARQHDHCGAFALREDVPRRRCNQDRARGMESPRHDRTRLGPRARTSIAADRPEGSSAPTGPMLRPQGLIGTPSNCGLSPGLATPKGPT